MADPLKAARASFKAGQADEGLNALIDAIRRDALSPTERARAGKMAIARRDAVSEALRLDDERVLVLGQCTTSWLVQCVAAAALRDGTVPRIVEGEFDNVMQELLSPATAEFEPTTVVLVPWSNRLLQGERGAAERIDQACDLWEQAASLAAEKHGARVVLVGFDWVHPGASGYHLAGHPGGAIDIVRTANARLRDQLPEGAYFVDLPAVSGDLGRRRFYDPRRYYWTKQPFSEEGTSWLAEHVWAGVRSLRNGPKKVLVLDLDNTVWGGVVGEEGPLGVEVGESPDGEAHLELQRFAKDLTKRGVLLAVASKNNDADAREPFEQNPSMVLALDDVASFHAHWDPKPVSIASIADELRLGSDSFVFIDDSAVERDLMRHQAPEVATVQTPPDPSEYVRQLVRELHFEAATVTGADLKRVEQYRVESRRKTSQRQFGDLGAYLDSLEMKGDIRPVDAGDLPRVTQLVGKTNQFNLTTRRHSREVIEEMAGRDRSLCLTLRLVDKFGDYGLISVVLAVPSDESPSTLEIDTWLMSCRALSRTVEEFFFATLLRRAEELGYERIVGTFAPTKKNAQVRELYPRLGFELLDESSDGTMRFSLGVSGASPPVTHVSPA